MQASHLVFDSPPLQLNVDEGGLMAMAARRVASALGLVGGVLRGVRQDLCLLPPVIKLCSAIVAM